MQQTLEGSLVEVVANEAGFSLAELRGQGRCRPLSTVRHIAVWFAKTEWGCSYPEAARLVGRSDHTTAIHSVRRVERLLASGDYWTRDLVRRVHTRLALAELREE